MTKTAAAAITSVLVPYFSRKGKWQNVESYRVTRVRGGYIVKGPRGEYHVTLHPDGYLACPCDGYAFCIERNGEELPAYCRHLCLIAAAHIMITEIRAEATEDKPAPVAYTDTMIDFDPFSEPAVA